LAAWTHRPFERRELQLIARRQLLWSMVNDGSVSVELSSHSSAER
jgi:hypothetical protein